jgi:Protein of unknown function (DUF4236)
VNGKSDANREPQRSTSQDRAGAALTVGWYLRKALRFGPLRVNLSRAGVGLSAGVTGARFGLDATGHPYVHAGRGGLYYRRRWPSGGAAGDPMVLPPEEPPPTETHGRIGWTWVALLIVGLILGQVLLRVWR